MDSLRNLAVAAVAAVAVVALASCGVEVSGQTDVAASTASSSSPSSTKSGTGSQFPSAVAEPATSAKDLFSIIDAAVAKEVSVRQELGNLNPPPPVVIEQEYGDGRDQLALTVDLGPHADPLQIYHVDGLVYYAEGQDPKPTSEIDRDDTALIAVMVRSDVRQDFQRMEKLADDFSYVGEEEILGVTTRHYRVTLTLAPGANPAALPSQLEGPKPADLWIATSGLPVRVDVKYSEPLNGTPGTGVSRTHYSAWSERLNLDPENLDWE